MGFQVICSMDTPKNIDEKLKKLGKTFQKIRKAKGFKNYEQFAFDNNISRAQYGRYEKGQDLRFSSLCRILTALDISFVEFFTEYEGEDEAVNKL